MALMPFSCGLKLFSIMRSDSWTALVVMPAPFSSGRRGDSGARLCGCCRLRCVRPAAHSGDVALMGIHEVAVEMFQVAIEFVLDALQPSITVVRDVLQQCEQSLHGKVGNLLREERLLPIIGYEPAEDA